MSKQHYDLATYKAQTSVGYLVKRAHSLMLDVMEPLIEERGFTFMQYVVLSCLRDGIAVNHHRAVGVQRHAVEDAWRGDSVNVFTHRVRVTFCR